MSGAATTYLTARFLLPEYITRASDNAVSCPVYQDGALVAPTSGTFTLTDQAGLVIYTAAVAIVGSIATATVPAANIPDTLSFGFNWRASWDLVFSGVVEHFANSAHLVRSTLSPVVADADLFRRVSALDPAGTSPISSLADYQDYRDEAWASLLARIAGQGPMPYLIMEPTALREAHLMLTLQLIFEDFATRLNEVYAERGELYANRYDAAFDRMRFAYDADQDGNAEGSRKRPARSSVWFQ